MKISSFYVLGLLAALAGAALHAQTNTFPTSGNVGIGTTSPSGILTVATVASDDGVRVVVPSGSGNYGGIRFEGTVGGWGLASIRAVDAGAYNGDLVFSTDGDGANNVNLTERMRIMNSGNVGIGTTSPGTSGGGGSPRTLEIKGMSGQIVPWGQLVLSSPAAGAAGDVLGGIEFAARGVSSYQRGGYIYSFKEDNSTTAANARLELGVANGAAAYTAMTIRASGNVGIGTGAPGSYKLAVNGTIHAQEVVVDLVGWSDYVFAPDYKLAPLSEVESHIKAEGHLPGIPSAKEVAERGVSMGEMQSKLLAKIEELTLHQIEQEKQLKVQAEQVAGQSTRIERLETENAALRRAMDPR